MTTAALLGLHGTRGRNPLKPVRQNPSPVSHHKSLNTQTTQPPHHAHPTRIASLPRTPSYYPKNKTIKPNPAPQGRTT